MSRGRLISSNVLTAAVVLAAGGFATASFPLEASPLVGMQEGKAPQMLVRVELFPNLPEPLRSNLRARLAGFQGRPYTAELRAEVLKAAQEVDSTARILMMSQSETADGTRMATLIVVAGPGTQAMSPLPPARGNRIQVGGADQHLNFTLQ
ncbi:MAG TPA: hypothetical protein VLH09_04600 [Bryobacteraceae bacterium]|nr:hypothetical protein [Bryobacteraceae bacterium]